MSTLSVTLLGLATAQAQAPAKPADNNPDSGTFSGKVVETMNAATYTYVLVDIGSKKVWAAAPAFQANTGDVITVSQALPMANYHSKTLKRDFDVVYFAANVTVQGKSPGVAAVGAEPVLPAGHPPIGKKAAPVMPDLTGIKKADGGKTVEEVVAGKSKLSGKTVTVRGKVVKYNGGVMGKNWLHIRDGSGQDGSNDLTVTTATPSKLGDTVLVVGKVSTDRDFGGGYKYAVIIEDAKVTVE